MRLIYTNASPFARKVRIAARETGVEFDLVFDHPTAEGTAVPDINPLGKVPALILDDGTVILDSPVICEFIDQQADDSVLLPPAGADRIRVQTLQAIADGIMDATVSKVLFLRRPETERSAYWLDRWDQAIRRTLPVLEDRVLAETDFNLGVISAICALQYLDFRFPEMAYLEGRPGLLKLLAEHADRRSVRDTMPFDGPSR